MRHSLYVALLAGVACADSQRSTTGNGAGGGAQGGGASQSSAANPVGASTGPTSGQPDTGAITGTKVTLSTVGQNDGHSLATATPALWAVWTKDKDIALYPFDYCTYVTQHDASSVPAAGNGTWAVIKASAMGATQSATYPLTYTFTTSTKELTLLFDTNVSAGAKVGCKMPSAAASSVDPAVAKGTVVFSAYGQGTVSMGIDPRFGYAESASVPASAHPVNALIGSFKAQACSQFAPNPPAVASDKAACATVDYN